MTTAGRRSPAKRAAILRAATDVFLSQGYRGASVDAIAAEAGVGKQTVYGHFGDKEKLFLAVITEAREEKAHEHADAVPDTGDPLADLTTAGVRVQQGVLSPETSALHRLTIAELPHHPELQRMWRDEGKNLFHDQLVTFLCRQHERGRLAVPDPDRAARQFVYLVVTDARVRSLQGTMAMSDEERRDVAAQAADLIVRAHRKE